MFPKQNFAQLSRSICTDGYNMNPVTDKELRRLGADVHAQFRENMPEIRILELMYTRERTFYVVLENHVDISSIKTKLPGRIAKCPVGYVRDAEFRRPPWTDSMPAQRVAEPPTLQGIIDDIHYDVLRPGVLIRSKSLRNHAHPAIFSTTSGVLVNNSAGDRFMTAASHGIGQGETVWHANRPEKIIGEAVVEISFTDVSLLMLKDNIVYVNETFDTGAGVTPKYTGLKTSEDASSWPSVCYMNSAFTGNMEGTIVARSVKFQSSPHPTEERMKYIVYNWAYLGQEEGNDDKGTTAGWDLRLGYLGP